MSSTTTIPVNEAEKASAPVNAAITAARDMPSLIANLKTVDPALAAPLEGKALLASKTPWGTLAVAVVSWAASRYGFGWDDQTCALIAGLGIVGGSYLMRALTSSPITGWFKKATP
ncbi:MAG TPA: hypothetical protein VN702_17655 [Acetobacteraceae bacterium]|nr:hypothetical protein [Acetobacteraceae bacterium]